MNMTLTVAKDVNSITILRYLRDFITSKVIAWTVREEIGGGLTWQSEPWSAKAWRW